MASAAGTVVAQVPPPAALKHYWTLGCYQAVPMKDMEKQPGSGVRIWAADWPRSNGDASKRFFSDTQTGMDAKMKELDAKDRVFYEMLVSGNVPPSCAACRLYLDCEYERDLMTADQLEVMPGDPELSRMISRSVIRHVRSLPGLGKGLAASVRILDASKANKFSMHMIFKLEKDGREVVFKDNSHVGALMRAWHRAQEKELPWYVPKRMPKKDGVVVEGVSPDPTCVIDMGVYTRNRQLRLPASTKLGQCRPLLALAGGRKIGADDTLKRWQQFLVQDHCPALAQDDPRIILSTTEIDGSSPVFTSVGYDQMMGMRSRGGPGNSTILRGGEPSTKRRRVDVSSSVRPSTTSSDLVTDSFRVYHPRETMFAPCFAANLEADYAVDESESMERDLISCVKSAPPGPGQTLVEAIVQWVANLTGDHQAYHHPSRYVTSRVKVRCPSTRACHVGGREHRRNSGYMVIDTETATARYLCGDPDPPCGAHAGVSILMPRALVLHMYVAHNFKLLLD